MRRLFFVMFLSFTCSATEHDGWRWYKSNPMPIEVPKKEPVSTSAVTQTTLSPTQQMQWFHQYYAHVKNDSILHPKDSEKLKRLMELDQMVMNKSSELGMTKKRVLLENPELNYTIRRPTQGAARSMHLKQLREEKIQAVQALSKDGYGMFFVYKGKDPLAHRLAPSIQKFADTHQMDVLGVSLDGPIIGAIRDNRLNQNQLSVKANPALFLVHPIKKTIQPLAYGFISQEELLGRFLNLYTNFKTDF